MSGYMRCAEVEDVANTYILILIFRLCQDVAFGDSHVCTALHMKKSDR